MRSGRLFDDRKYIEVKTQAQINEMRGGHSGVLPGTKAPVNSPASTPFVSPVTSPRVPSELSNNQCVGEFEQAVSVMPTTPRR